MTRLVFPCLLAALMLTGCQNRPPVGRSPEVADVTVHPMSSEEFPAAWARSWCNREKECDAADYQNRWAGEGTADCEKTKSEQQDFRNDWQDLTCGDYQSARAAACLDSMRTMSCGDWANKQWRESCRNVFGC